MKRNAALFLALLTVMGLVSALAVTDYVVFSMGGTTDVYYILAERSQPYG